MVKDFQEFISHFNVKRRTGNRYQCVCPCHADKKESLTITDVGDKPLIKCFAGCNTYDILAVVGLDKSDLFYGHQKEAFKEERWKIYAEGRISKQEGHTVKITKRYDHIDLQGRYVCSKLRCHPKTFRYGIISDGRITLSLPKAKKDMPSFYCPDFPAFQNAIQDGKTVYYVEGCKDADTLYRYGYMAISCGGSGDWNSEIAKAFDGAKKVIVFSDNDEAGRKLSRQVYRDLVKVAEDVQIVRPCLEVKGGDISDLIELHGAKALHRVARFDKYQFHMFAEKKDKDSGEVTRKISGVFDYEIFKYITLTRSILVCGGVVYMYQDGIFVPDISGAKLKTAIRELIFPQYIKSNTIKRVFDLFLSAEELQTVPEEFNKQPDSWVCFRNGYYDPVSKKMIPHNPKWQTVNQLPHEYHPEEKPKGELIESWLNDVIGADEREMILQYAGYCCTTDIRQQKYMIINGIGGTGKSTIIGLIENMIGVGNTTAIALDQLSQRFSSYGLMWKLLNSCADLKIDVLDDSSMIKKLSGEDFLMGEAKGRQAVPFKSYARLIFSTNELPLIKEERSDAFYRRLLVLPMNKKPEKQDPFFSEKLNDELDYFIHLCMDALGRLYESGLIHVAESSIKAVKQLRQDSDVVQAFLDAKTVTDANGKIERSELYTGFSNYCKEVERQALNRTNFFKALRNKNYPEGKIRGNWYFKNVSWGGNNSPDDYIQADENELKEIGWL